MDERLLNRLQLGSAGLVVVSYFLPWASIMSPFGSVDVKGLYIDYAWVLLVLGVLHLLVQIGIPHRESVGIPETWIPYLSFVYRVSPFVIFGFIAWNGAHFAFSQKSVGDASIFGTEIPTAVKASLDYGYWLGALAALVLIYSVGTAVKQVGRFSLIAGVLIIGALGIAFGSSEIVSKSAGSQKIGDTNADTAQSDVPQHHEIDYSQVLQIVSIRAEALEKDVDAERFSNSIIVYPVFRNVGAIAIVGIQGRIALLDGFGKEVYSFAFRYDEKLLPGEQDKGASGYSFDENEFEDDDPYHKMAPLVNGGTARFAATISEIAFEDGTVLPKP